MPCRIEDTLKENRERCLGCMISVKLYGVLGKCPLPADFFSPPKNLTARSQAPTKSRINSHIGDTFERLTHWWFPRLAARGPRGCNCLKIKNQLNRLDAKVVRDNILRFVDQIDQSAKAAGVNIPFQHQAIHLLLSHAIWRAKPQS